MKTIFISVLSLFIVVVVYSPAGAWSHANRYGGSTEHAYGEGTEHTSAWGTSTAHAWGGGTEHTNVYGGTTAGRYGEGAYHEGPYGGTAYRPPAPYYPYHPPVAVPYYSSTCAGCAATAGAVVGMAAGAAVASANTAAATSTAYSAGVAAGSANTAAATSSAYNAGVVAGATGAASISYVMGANYATLPAGCATPNVQGKTYYLCGNTWFLPSYGANGVYYKVVPTP